MDRIHTQTLCSSVMSGTMRTSLAAFGLALVLSGSGCAAFTNPLVDGIPVRRLPPEAFGESRAEFKPVPLTSLTPPGTETYKLAPGDVLGVFIENVLGKQNEPPPVQIREQGQGNLPPGIGYPIPVRENGTVPLPLIPPLNVSGLTIQQAQDKITEAYQGKLKDLQDPQKKLVIDGITRIIVTLYSRRQYHVLVLREDTGGTTTGAGGGFTNGFGGGGTFVSQTRRTAGFPLDLPAYENDLLNALTRSGGLPGLEAQDEVLIIRGAYRPGTGVDPLAATDSSGRETIRIPMRLHPGETPTIRPSDLILQTGDVVHVRARIGDIFYTGGLLPPHAFPLPPDRDIDIIEAIALVGGPVLNGGLAANNLSGQIVQTGLGFPSPSLVTIVRKLQSGAQIPIVVNLNRAFKDPRERIAIRPGDYVILQATPGEALGQYVTSNLRFNLLSSLFHSQYANGTVSYTAP